MLCTLIGLFSPCSTVQRIYTCIVKANICLSYVYTLFCQSEYGCIAMMINNELFYPVVLMVINLLGIISSEQDEENEQYEDDLNNYSQGADMTVTNPTFTEQMDH